MLEEDGKRVTIVFKNHQCKVKLVSEGGSENVSATGSRGAAGMSVRLTFRYSSFHLSVPRARLFASLDPEDKVGS